MTKTRTNQWYVEASLELHSRTCRVVSLRFFQAHQLDAAQDADDSSRMGNSVEMQQRYRERAEALHGATGSTAYLSGMHGKNFTVQLQCNHGESRWYAPHVTHAELDPEVVRALGRLCGLNRSVLNSNALDAIKILRAKYVRFIDAVNGYVPCATPDLLVATSTPNSEK